MKKLLLSLLLIVLVLSLATSALSHPGRTDSKGGHKDNKNASGLGAYHYHCGTNNPHLHTNGCPYGGSGGTKSSGGSGGSRTAATAKPTARPTQRPALAPVLAFVEGETVLGRTKQRDVPVFEFPDADSKLLGKIPEDRTAVKLFGFELDGYGIIWYCIEFEDVEAYVLAAYVDIAD